MGRVPIDEDLADALDRLRTPRPSTTRRSIARSTPSRSRCRSFSGSSRGLRVVPAMMGHQSRGQVDALSDALASALKGRDDVVLVASSDLSHYHPAEVANREDAVVVEQVGEFDDEGLMRRLESHENVACGGGPVVAVMKAARALGADRATVLRYADSGDAGGGKEQVVGYLSAALTAT